MTVRESLWACSISMYERARAMGRRDVIPHLYISCCHTLHSQLPPLPNIPPPSPPPLSLRPHLILNNSPCSHSLPPEGLVSWRHQQDNLTVPERSESFPSTPPTPPPSLIHVSFSAVRLAVLGQYNVHQPTLTLMHSDIYRITVLLNSLI